MQALHMLRVQAVEVGDKSMLEHDRICWPTSRFRVFLLANEQFGNETVTNPRVAVFESG